MSNTVIAAATESGSVVGFRKPRGVLHFRGIPYAAAPFGERRFRAPERHPGWVGDRDATVTGATSPQREPAFRGRGFNYRAIFCPGWVRGDEILNLNIWTTSLTGKAPVMVYIHGGAFDHGNGAVPLYDGTRFAESGVVLVTINYRLGLEGFLLLEGGEANVAIQDQIAALEWVSRNIAGFGGDPDNVTIFGESAGAASVNLLLTAPKASKLFHKAISQSGMAPDAPSAESARTVTQQVAEELGLAPTAEAFRNLPPEALLVAAEDVAKKRAKSLLASEGTLIARPHADGKVLPISPREAFAAGSAADKRVIWGFNSDEATLFTVPNGLHAKATMDDVQRYTAGVNANPERLIAYVRTVLGDAASPGQVRDRIQSWAMFGAGSVRSAGVHARNGDKAWLYEFAWKSPQLDGTIGASHLVELPFVFDALQHPNVPAMVGDEAPQALAADMHGRWVAFAKTGDPGWPNYDEEKAVSMTFDQHSVTESGRHRAEMEVWNHG